LLLLNVTTWRESAFPPYTEKTAMENRKNRKHLKRLDCVHDNILSPIFFVTICSEHRKPVLTNPDIAPILVGAFKDSGTIHGWSVGRYVVMPDHIHFFCAQKNDKKNLPAFIRDFKRWTTSELKRQGIDEKIWQKEFFDHLLRNDESYEEKWIYTKMNPARKGFCDNPDDWPYQGECDQLLP